MKVLVSDSSKKCCSDFTDLDNGQITYNTLKYFLGLNSFQNNLKQQKMFYLKLCMANK